MNPRKCKNCNRPIGSWGRFCGLLCEVIYLRKQNRALTEKLLERLKEEEQS